MNGREIPANPASAMGSFSSSLNLSRFVEKYSSGSLSLVSFFGSSPSPRPNPIFNGVALDDDAVYLLFINDFVVVVVGANPITDDNDKAIATTMMKERRWDENMMFSRLDINKFALVVMRKLMCRLL